MIKLSHDTPKTVRVYHMVHMAHRGSKRVILDAQSGEEWLMSLSFTPDEARQIAKLLTDAADKVENDHRKAFGE